jgi:hypothetical protein
VVHGLRHFDHRTLLICAENDVHFGPEWGERLRRDIPGAERLRSLFAVVSLMLVAWGVVFALFGLGVLPVDRHVLLAWESAIYGAIMMGWGTTLFLVGRVALRRHGSEP